MKLILTADVPNLGTPGDIVEVKDGYGRNLLLPRNLAIPATRGAEKQVAALQRAQRARKVRDLSHAKEVAAGIGALTLTVRAKAAGDTGRLFGSVTTADVVAAVKTAGGPALDRHDVTIADQIKTVGTHQVSISLHPEVVVDTSIEVVAS